MGNFLVRVLINAVAIAITSYFVGGVDVQTNLVALFVVGAIITIINATIKPILSALSIPITVITLGLFILVINAAMLGLAAWLSGDMLDVNGFWPALLGGIVLAIVNMVLESVLGANRRTPVNT
jgi:putative membrane protein